MRGGVCPAAVRAEAMLRVSQRRRIRVGARVFPASRVARLPAATDGHRLSRVAAWGSLALHAALAGALALGGGSPPAAPATYEFRVLLEPSAMPPPSLDPAVAYVVPELFPAMPPPVVGRIEYPERVAIVPPDAISPEPERVAPDGEVQVAVSPAEGAAGSGASDAAASAYWSGGRARIAAALRYPPDALARRIEGVVWVAIEVDARGVPVRIEIADGAPDALAAAVRRALDRAGLFEPPPDGAPRRARLPIRFAGRETGKDVP